MMNKYLILFLSCFLIFSGVKAQIKITAPLTTNSPTDQYPTHFDSLGNGGYISFGNFTERNNLPKLRRKRGMIAYVAESDSLYILSDDDLSTWRGFAKGKNEVVFDTDRPITTVPEIDAVYGDALNNDINTWLNRLFSERNR